MKKIVTIAWPPIAAFILILIFMQIAVQTGWIEDYILASPSQIWSALTEYRSELMTALSATLISTLIGLVFSFITAFLTALLFTQIKILERAFYPFSVFFQTVPIIAIAPLLVVWFGFGDPTVRASAFIVSFFPLLASTMRGLKSVDPALLELFKSYRASKIQTLFMLRLPSSFPFVLTGLRLAGGLAVVGAIVGEFVGGGGLGSLIDVARTQQRTDLVFAAVLLASVLGLFVVSLIALLEFFFLRWRPFILR